VRHGGVALDTHGEILSVADSVWLVAELHIAGLLGIPIDSVERFKAMTGSRG